MYFDIHTHNKTNQSDVFSLVNQYPNNNELSIPFSIGIHPWYIEDNGVAQLDLLENKLNNNNCYAIGECGLDKLTNIDFDLQTQLFSAQIKLSEAYKKPLIIHCVRAFNEVIMLKKQHKTKQPWIIHGVNKNNQITKDLLKNNCYLSFGKALLVNSRLQNVFKQTPLENIFLETDDSNETIVNIYKKAAYLKELDIEDLKQSIHQNFNRIFKQ